MHSKKKKSFNVFLFVCFCFCFRNILAKQAICHGGHPDYVYDTEFDASVCLSREGHENTFLFAVHSGGGAAFDFDIEPVYTWPLSVSGSLLRNPCPKLIRHSQVELLICN